MVRLLIYVFLATIWLLQYIQEEKPGDAFGAWSSFWGVVFQFYGALFALFGLMAVLYAVKQLRLSAWANAQDTVTDPSFIGARAFVLKCFEQKAWQPTYTAIERAKLVCRMWDKLACLVEERSISKRKVLEYSRYPMGKCWIVVQERWHVIATERDISVGHIDKWHAFYALGREAATIIRKETPELNA